MAVTLGDVGRLAAYMVLDRSDWKQGLDESRREASLWGNVVQGIFQGVGQRIFTLVEGGVRGAVREINRSMDAASDLAESVNKTSVVFGHSAGEILDWSRTTDRALGQSRQQALEAAGSFGNLFTSMGVARSESARMGRSLVELASDLASFNNIDPTLALEKLRAGIVGETEPLRTLGVNLNARTVELKAMQMGLAATGDALTDQQKIMARYALILEQTANAQGDFARTADGAANAQRRFNAQMENMRATFGSAFLPIKQEVLNVLSDVLAQMAPYGENIVSQLALGFAAGIRAITPALVMLRDVFTYWLRPGSPPRLLPDLVRWGIGAVNAYLGGWSQGDFSIFDELGGRIRAGLASLVGSGRLSETGFFSSLFGSRSALAQAVNEFARAGRVSEETFRRIRAAAGDLGGQVESLARAYFNLRTASEASRRAQQDLLDVQNRYDEALQPVDRALADVRARQQEIADQKRLAELRAVINRWNVTDEEREAALLEMRLIDLERQRRQLEAARDEAVDTAQERVDAAQAAEDQAREQLELQRASLDQVVAYNQLLAEQRALYERLGQQADAAFKRAEAEAQRLYSAQLAYKLALADTPGKIALLREELSKLSPENTEYWQILTQIAVLEGQLKEGRTALGDLPQMPPLELPDIGALGNAVKGTQELAGALREMFTALGLLRDDPNTAEGFIDQLDRLNRLASSEPGDALPQWIKDLIDGLRGTSEELGTLNENFSGFTSDMGITLSLFKGVFLGEWDDMWDHWAEKQQRDLDASTTSWGRYWNGLYLKLLRSRGDFSVVSAQISADFAALSKWLGQWLEDTADALLEGGGRWVTNLWDGIKGQWSAFKRWWDDNIGSLFGGSFRIPGFAGGTSFAPGGLALVGEAGPELVNLPRGSQVASTADILSRLQGGGDTITQNFYGYPASDRQAIRQAARDGYLDAKRARGG